MFPKYSSRSCPQVQTLLASLALVATSSLANAADITLPVTAVCASANDGNLPANTIDGSLSTRWSAQGDGQWITYDLGTNSCVNSVAIAWYQGTTRTSKFDIKTSVDGNSWASVYSGLSSGKTTALEGYDVADTTARFVSIIGHGNTVNTWNSITEVQLIGTAVPTQTTTTNAASESLISVAGVAASGDDGNVAANTLDGSLATRWSAQGDGQWIMYDLGATKTVSSVDIAWHKGDTRASKFDIKTSPDGSVWNSVYSGSSSGKSLAFETYDVAQSAARYVSIVGHGNTANTWNSITETAIYALTAATNSTTTNPPSTNVPPAVITLPAQLLNLTNWKLTLPVDTSHAGCPDEYQQPELAGFADSQFFHLNTNNNGVVFKAHCGGYTTSGSGYPRSELREMINNGATKASWSTTNGTHTMVITQAITHLPVFKPHVVAGQIHDANDDVIVYRLEGQTLFIDLNGKTGPILATNYQLGDVFTVAFVARNGTVECYYNGQYIYTYPVKAAGCYFKAGVYTQSNTTKGDAPDAYGEVTIYGLSVTHQ